MTAGVRRAFVDLPDGQVHLRRQSDPSDRLPLYCLHPSPASSLSFAELLPLLGREAVAVDTPGFGESFRPAAQPAIADYARWIAQVPGALGHGQIDLLGMFTGAAIAAEIAVSAPTLVRRLILVGPPLFTPDQQAGFLRDAWPARPREDGSHIAELWRRLMMRPMPVPFLRRVDTFHEYFRGGENAIWGEQAVAAHPLAERLPLVRQPTLVVEPAGIAGDCRTALTMLEHGAIESLDCPGYAVLQAEPEKLAAIAAAFLDELPQWETML